MVFKRIATFITVLVFSITGAPSIAHADVGDENAGSFDDTDAIEETEDQADVAEAAGTAGTAGTSGNTRTNYN